MRQRLNQSCVCLNLKNCLDFTPNSYRLYVVCSLVDCFISQKIINLGEKLFDREKNHKKRNQELRKITYI